MERKNKKGADRVLSLYWFAILALSAAGVFVMVSTFHNSLYDVRSVESGILLNRISSCISEQGEFDSSILDNLGDSVSEGDLSSCQDAADCQRKTGLKIINIVNGIKSDFGIENIDGQIKDEGVAQNLNCLVLGIALQESSLQHCKDSRDESGNFLYCDGNQGEVKVLSSENENSLGVMQVNIKAHEGVRPENFEEGVEYAVKDVLVKGYKSYKDGKVFTGTGIEYFGWKAAIRSYNGWGEGGNNNYVEEVVSNKEIISQIFPEYCSEDFRAESNLKISELCNMKFQQEEYYLEISFYEFNSNSLVSTIREGNFGLKADCEIQDSEEYRRLAKCSEKTIYSVDSENKKFKIKILSAIRKLDENVR